MININGKEWNKVRLKDIEHFLEETEDDETFFIEFKEENIRNSQIAKEVSAFANSYGGYLFLGIDDSKNIIGCTNKWTELRLNTIICNSISPVPYIDIKKFKLKNSNTLFVIKVEEGFNTPYITNTGNIYHRISSSSDIIKDSNTLNLLYQKERDNKELIERKIYLPKIEGEIPNNVCGYIDFGFSLVTRNFEKTMKCIINSNLEDISNLLKESNIKYSVSKIGHSIVITLGETTVNRGENKMLPQGGLTNYFEILPDGSVKIRIILYEYVESDIVNISSVSGIYSICSQIYKIVFGETLSKNFVEASLYESLTTLKIFKPKIITNNPKENIQFEKYHENHVNKYGNNLVVNNNRFPISGFFKIDKKYFKDNKIKYNNNNLYSQLFASEYALLGYIDKINID